MPNSQLTKVQQSALRILDLVNINEVYEQCVKEAAKLAQVEFGSLFLEKNNILVRTFSTVPLEYQLVPRKDGVTYSAFQKGELKFIFKKALSKSHPEADQKFKMIVVIPLHYQDKKMGVITLQSSRQRNYTYAQKQGLKLLGSFVALAIRNIQLYEDSQFALNSRELFMSTAAHELRTPLTALHAYAQIIQKNFQENKPVQPKWIDSVISNSQMLKTLIQELFSVSQMSMGVFAYTFSECNLLEILQHSITNNKISHKRNIIFQNKVTSSNFLIKADKEKIELVLNNVIGNAIKYSKRPSEVFVEIEKEGNFYRISVTDKGQGIKADDLPHIFKRFYQGARGSSNGLGLGMYLCKEITQAHNGDIRVESKVNKGTTVHIYIPS